LAVDLSWSIGRTRLCQPRPNSSSRLLLAK
jgi:hypothetical protein